MTVSRRFFVLREGLQDDIFFMSFPRRRESIMTREKIDYASIKPWLRNDIRTGLLWCAMVSKLIGEPVKVRQDRNSVITAFTWRQRLYRITGFIGWWREPSDWWNGKAVRLFVRVSARNSTTGTYELYRLGEEWFLSRILD